jgi:hypothetical protein
MLAYKFRIGQNVKMAGGHMGGPQSNARFEVVRHLPETGGRCQYRIRSTLDGHERVVTEAELV